MVCAQCRWRGVPPAAPADRWSSSYIGPPSHILQPAGHFPGGWSSRAAVANIEGLISERMGWKTVPGILCGDDFQRIEFGLTPDGRREHFGAEWPLVFAMARKTSVPPTSPPIVLSTQLKQLLRLLRIGPFSGVREGMEDSRAGWPPGPAPLRGGGTARRKSKIDPTHLKTGSPPPPKGRSAELFQCGRANWRTHNYPRGRNDGLTLAKRILSPSCDRLVPCCRPKASTRVLPQQASGLRKGAGPTSLTAREQVDWKWPAGASGDRNLPGPESDG